MQNAAMTFDFTSMPPPEEWERFRTMVRRARPALPDMGGGPSATGTASDVLTMTGAAASGLGDALPSSVGAGVGLAGTALSTGSALASGDVVGAANAVADDLIGRGVDMLQASEGGWLVGGLIMIARGFHQSLSRSDEMVSYLNMLGGYTHTLVRASIAAVNDPFPYTRMPMPVVPAYVERTGDLYSDFTRNAFTEGYNRVAAVVRHIDEVRPPTGDYPSKRCLLHIGLQANMTGGRGADLARMRERAERYVARQLLCVDVAAQAEALRRWANAH